MERRLEAIAAKAARTLTGCTAAVAVTIVMTWPLAADPGSLGRSTNSGDARFAIWNVAWVAHALITDPADLFDANIFYPHRRTLAYSEANVGAGVLAVPVWWWTRNPHAAHNAVVFFSFAASLIATWLLVRRLTQDAWAAATSALLFAFCPYIFSHTAHIQLLMAAGIPLAMLMLHRIVDSASPARGVHLGLVLAAQALSCAYYGIFAGLMVGAGALFFAWSRGLWTSARYWIAITIGAALSMAIVFPFFLPYMAIQEETGFARSLDDARMFSVTWRSYLASAAHAHRWMLPELQRLGGWNGEVLFPGFIGTLLAIWGLGVALRSRHADASPARLTPAAESGVFYASMGALAFWTSLGPAGGFYSALYYAIPVFSLLRAPGRTGIVLILAMAVLAGFAVRALRARLPGGRASAASGAAICAAVLLELNMVPFDWRPAAPVPGPYKVLASLPRGPVAEFPFFERRIDFHIHTRYMLYSTEHWQPLVNGYSDFIPPDFRTLAVRLAGFPSRDSFDAMKERRVRYITINREALGGAAAQDVERRLEPYHAHLRLVAEDARLVLYEVLSWPN